MGENEFQVRDLRTGEIGVAKRFKHLSHAEKILAFGRRAEQPHRDEYIMLKVKETNGDPNWEYLFDYNVEVL